MKMNRARQGVIVSLIMLFCGAIFSSCGPTESDGPLIEERALKAVPDIAERKVRVVTTTNFVTDLVREVGADRLEIHELMGPGVDPHLYKAAAGDVGAITEADVVFFVIEDLESKLIEVIARSAHKRAIVAVTNDIDEDKLLLPPKNASYEGHYDPHVWFDTDLWATTPGVVARTLSALDPANEEIYQKNAARYQKQIIKAGERMELKLAAIPKEKRLLVTSHDAFRYFGRRFGVEVEAVQGISTVAEATTSQIDHIARLVVERRIGSVYIESSFPPHTINAVIAASKNRGFTPKIGGELFADAAGDAGTFEGTYLGMLEHNVHELVEGLA